MKIKTTKKEILNSGYHIIKIGYCDAQYLLYYNMADYYSAGVYGWSCDYYKFDEHSVIISTGYLPIGVQCNYELLKKYNAKAQKIIYNYKLSYKEQKNKVQKLLKAYLTEDLKNE